MTKFFLLVIFFSVVHFPQSDPIDFFSPLNIKSFADHLFCEGDYLRAVEQYHLIPVMTDDTTNYKIMYSYSTAGYLHQSNEGFRNFSEHSPFYPTAHLLILKNELILNRKSILSVQGVSNDSLYLKNLNKLKIISLLYDDELTYSHERFTFSFDVDEKEAVSKLYNEKYFAPYKSPVTAGVLSALIPGTGKMYVGEWGDGIMALLATGLLAFLAYDNFDAGHDTRAWIFTGLTGFFYLGNIYGSVAAAQIVNAKIDFDFNVSLNHFLEEKNYFVPEYEFCK
jgi:TM2 domain-containing membrane protein YozV